MRLRQYYVYIMMNGANTATYIGVTNSLLRRVYEHIGGEVRDFSQKHKLKKLVYFETCDTAEQAISLEKQLKNWHRAWKLNLIKTISPDFKDLALRLQEIPKQVPNDDRSGGERKAG